MNKALYFIAGAVIGSGITFFVVDKRSRKREDEAVASVRESLGKDIPKTEEKKEEEPNPSKEVPRETVEKFAQILKEAQYTDYADPDKIVEERKKPVDRPYVISPDEFGEFDDYENISLSFFADGILADDEFNIVDDPEDIVGSDFATRIDISGEDVVYVRNDAMKCDYEIARDTRRFDELGTNLY